MMLGHCYLDGKFTFWFYSFHMPLFYFLSGYTFKVKKGYGQFLRKKIKSLVVPYSSFAIIWMVGKGLLTVTQGNEYNMIEYILLFVLQQRFTPLWFIACLFVAEQIMYIMCQAQGRFTGKYYWMMQSVVTGVLFAGYRFLVGVNIVWNADLALLAAAFMCFGRFYADYLENRISKSVGILCGMLLSWLISYNLNGRVDWYANSFGNPALFVIAAVCGTLCLIKFAEQVRCKWLSWLGRNTILFFGLHRIVIDLVFVVFNKFGMYAESGSLKSLMLAIVNVLATVVLLIPVNWFMLRYFPWSLGKSKKG